MSDLNALTDQPLLTAGKILFAVSLCAITAMTILSAFLHKRVRQDGTQTEAGTNGGGEMILLIAVAVSIPLIAIRLVYAFLSSFGTDRARFSPFTGSVGLQVALSVWEEIVVVLMFVVVGFMVPKIVVSRKSSEEELEMGRAGTGDSRPRNEEHRWYDKQWIMFVPLVGLLAGVLSRSASKNGRR